MCHARSWVIVGLLVCSGHCTASTRSGRVHFLPWGVATQLFLDDFGEILLNLLICLQPHYHVPVPHHGQLLQPAQHQLHQPHHYFINDLLSSSNVSASNSSVSSPELAIASSMHLLNGKSFLYYCCWSWLLIFSIFSRLNVRLSSCDSCRSFEIDASLTQKTQILC